MNTLAKRIVAVALACILVVGSSIVTTVVVNKNDAIKSSATVENGLSAYEIAVSEGYIGSMQEWLSSLSGKSAYEIAKESGYSGTEDEYGKLINKLASSEPLNVKTASFNKDGQLIITLSDDTTINAGNAVGLNGKDGDDGLNGVGISDVNVNDAGELVLSFSNGKIVNVGKVVGATGISGKDGLSAYQIAVVSGLTTAQSEAEWINSLKGQNGAAGAQGAQGVQGEKGDIGTQGIQGVAGSDGKSAYEIAKDNGCALTVTEWLDTLKGLDGSSGKSAYEIAKNAGLTTDATESEWIKSLTGATGAQGTQGIQGEKGDTGAQGTQGIQGEKGDTGAQGIQGVAGSDGKSAYELAIDNGIITSMITEYQWLNSLKGEKGDKGDTGLQGAQGVQGEKGDAGAQGAQGIQGKKGDIGTSIQTITLQNGTMTITLSDSSTYIFENINVKDGISPQIRINSKTNKWEISSDNGTTWTSTQVNATGAKGEKGDTGAQGIQGETGSQGAKGDKGDNGTDGISPKIQINILTNEWEISVNNGLSWTSTGITATGAQGIQGEKGETGAQGTQGIQGEKGETGAQGTQGIQGEKGETGAQGTQGIQGEKGDTGVQGTQGIQGEKGDAGVSVTGVSLNNENKLVICFSEGGPIVLDKSLMGATGAKGDNGEDGVSVTSVTLTSDFYLEFTYSDGTKSLKLGPIKGDKGDKGDTGAVGTDGVGITTVSIDENGNLYITYSNTATPTLLGNIKGPKGDKGDSGTNGVGIASAKIDENGHLILTMTDNTTKDAGKVSADNSTSSPSLYTVTFMDWDGKVLKTEESVKSGASATAPSNPTRSGYAFNGWDKSFNNITADTVVTATYTPISANTHTVTFYDYDGTTILATRTGVVEGGNATPPPNPTKSNATFIGWNGTYTNVTKDERVRAVYSDEKNILYYEKNEQIGDTVTVTLKLDGTVSICAYALSVKYDESVLQLVDYNSELSTTYFSTVNPAKDEGGNITGGEPGNIYLAWADISNKTKKADIIKLKFKVLDPSKQTEISTVVNSLTAMNGLEQVNAKYSTANVVINAK